MADDTEQDRIEKFEIAVNKDGAYILNLQTKSEEFEVVADRDTLQELADAIHDQLDRTEAKRA